jgi:hypothetical protein
MFRGRLSVPFCLRYVEKVKQVDFFRSPRQFQFHTPHVEKLEFFGTIECSVSSPLFFSPAKLSLSVSRDRFGTPREGQKRIEHIKLCRKQGLVEKLRCSCIKSTPTRCFAGSSVPFCLPYFWESRKLSLPFYSHDSLAKNNGTH